MNKTLKLRGYQTEALDAIDAKLATGLNRVAVVLPTGMGKTVIFSHLIARETAKAKRVVVLVHRDELAEQAASKVRSVAPGVTVGIVKAERNEIDAQVLVCSVQTLARENRRAMIEGVGVVIVDECHHAIARTWMDVLRHFGAFPAEGEIATPAIGFTATLQRGDSIGLGDVWEDIAYERDIMYGIEHGFLSDVRAQMVTLDGFDLATIAKTRGDYQEGRLGDALISVNAGEHVAAAYREHASKEDGTLRRAILFAPTVASAFHFSGAMEEDGIRVATITGETPKEERELAYKLFENGDLDVLSNCMVLTEGFDAPWAEVAIVARPTQSAPLYTQMVGRVLRPFPGKDEALVLDVVGIAGAHQLRTLKDLSKLDVHEGESIEEAKERTVREANDAAVLTRVAGERKAREVEMFAASHSVWLRTKAGTWFIPVRNGMVVLWQKPNGTWSVGRKMDRQPGEWLVTGVEFEYALSWGEQIAADTDPMVAEKDRAWRRTKPSPAQLDLALRMRLGDPEELAAMRKGALSDLISIHFASRALDKKLAS
jgi:superfamily II DNA or RNA helicase